MTDSSEASARSSRCPALWAAAALALGLVAGTIRTPAWWSLTLAVPLAWLALTRLGRLTGWSPSLAALALVALGGWWWGARDPVSGLHQLAVAGVRGRFVGTIASGPQSRSETTRAELAVSSWAPDSMTVHPMRGRILLTVRAEQDLREGDRIAVRGRLHLPRSRANPGLFDYRSYLANRGVAGSLRANPEALELLGQAPAWSRAGLVRVVRGASLAVLHDHRLTDAFSLLPGLLLGQRWMVDASVEEALDGAGLTHLLAISGLHVGFVAVIIFPLLRALRLGRTGSAVGTAAGLAAYAVLTGARPSVVRATIMACVLILALANQRSWRPMNSLGVAAMAILILAPRSLEDAGFQLSFLATGAILALSRRVLDMLPRNRVSRFVVGALVVSVGAQVGVAPILARHFHEVHPVAPLANLLVIPLMGLGVALGFATLLSALVGSWLADIFAHANLIPLELSVRCAGWLGDLPGASVSVTSPTFAACAVYYAGLVVAAIALRTRRSVLWFLACSCAVLSLGLWWGGPISHGGLQVTVLDVGEGDAIFVRAPEGQTLLIDGGLRTRYGDMGREVVVPYLRSRGIRGLGALMLTHAHNDHVGGLASVVEEMRVGHAFGTGYAHTSWSYRGYIRALRDREVPTEWVREGDIVPLGAARLIILYPRESDLEELRENPRLGLNAISIVARLVYGRFSMLLAGDAEESTERALLRRGLRLASDVLKAGHHGAATSSTSEFLRAVSAEVAIISAGAQNRFGHPHRAALARLGQAGCAVYRTDLHGAVTVVSDGRSYRVRTTRPVGVAAATAG